MQLILQKAVFDDKNLIRYINRFVALELNKLTEPCYYPEWKKNFYEILHMTKLTENDIKQFIKRFYKGTKAQDAKLQSDVGSNLLIILMYHFLEKKDEQTFLTLIVCHMIRQYSNFLRRVLKFCKPEVFTYTMDNLNKSHLFIREKTIANTLFHISQGISKRYIESFLQLDADKISNFLYESRSRIAQSLRSFAEAYYQFEEEGKGIGSQEEDENGESMGKPIFEKPNRIVDMIVKKMCIYKQIDYDALNEVKNMVKINSSYAVIIAKELHKTELAVDVKYLSELFFKEISKMDELCGKQLILKVRRLMSLKHTVKLVYFKQEVIKLFEKIIRKTSIYNKYKDSTNQTKFQFYSFLALYFTFYIRNVACK